MQFCVQLYIDTWKIISYLQATPCWIKTKTINSLAFISVIIKQLMLIIFFFCFLGLAFLKNWNWNMPIIKTIEIFSYFATNWFEHVPWKMSDSVSFLIFEFTLVINLRNFDFKSHWNTLIFTFWLKKKKNDVRFEYVSWKIARFCFISIAWVHFSHKTKKFWFCKLLKFFNIFW